VGIVRPLDGVVRRGNRLATQLDHATDGNLVLPPGVDRLIVGEAHEETVVAHELGREFLLERAGRRSGGRSFHAMFPEAGFGLKP